MQKIFTGKKIVNILMKKIKLFCENVIMSLELHYFPLMTGAKYLK